MTENGIYSPLMKVISNNILLVYSLRGALIKIARGCHTQWSNFFDGTTPLLEKVRRYLVEFSYTDYSKRNSNWHTCTNPRPGQYVPNACAKPYHPGVGYPEYQALRSKAAEEIFCPFPTETPDTQARRWKTAVSTQRRPY